MEMRKLDVSNVDENEIEFLFGQIMEILLAHEEERDSSKFHKYMMEVSEDMTKWFQFHSYLVGYEQLSHTVN